MAYREIIELDASEVIEIAILVEGVTVGYILQPAAKAFKDAVDFMERESENLHHSSNFKLEIMISQ